MAGALKRNARSISCANTTHAKSKVHLTRMALAVGANVIEKFSETIIAKVWNAGRMRIAYQGSAISATAQTKRIQLRLAQPI